MAGSEENISEPENTDGADDRNGRHIGKAYTITDPEALSYSRAAEMLSNVTGKKISYVNVCPRIGTTKKCFVI